MGRLILIRKHSEKNNIHYYAVFKSNSLKEISYFMGLDSSNKKILFFEDEKFEKILCMYDPILDKFITQDLKIKSLISAFVIIKGLNALKVGDFPQSLSWES